MIKERIILEFDLGQVVGADGKGIVSIELISTSGKNKTYRITFTDETYFDYTVKDGEDAISAIVTSWEQTLSDSKVPSEKLTKDTLDTKVDKITGKGLSTEDYTTAEKTKLAGVEEEANKTVVDSSLSDSSTNPVQNKVVKGALDLKADTSSLATVATTGDYDDLTNKPVIPPGVVVDQTLDSSSTNAVANQAVVGGLNNKSDTSHTHTNWTTLACGSYGTLIYNDDLRIAQFRYVRTYNITTANRTITIEDDVIPSAYRLSNGILFSSILPEVSGGAYSTGSVFVRSTSTGSKNLLFMVMYHY